MADIEDTQSIDKADADAGEKKVTFAESKEEKQYDKDEEEESRYSYTAASKRDDTEIKVPEDEERTDPGGEENIARPAGEQAQEPEPEMMRLDDLEQEEEVKQPINDESHHIDENKDGLKESDDKENRDNSRTSPNPDRPSTPNSPNYDSMSRDGAEERPTQSYSLATRPATTFSWERDTRESEGAARAKHWDDIESVSSKSSKPSVSTKDEGTKDNEFKFLTDDEKMALATNPADREDASKEKENSYDSDSDHSESSSSSNDDDDRKVTRTKTKTVPTESALKISSKTVNQNDGEKAKELEIVKNNETHDTKQKSTTKATEENVTNPTVVVTHVTKPRPSGSSPQTQPSSSTAHSHQSRTLSVNQTTPTRGRASSAVRKQTPSPRQIVADDRQERRQRAKSAHPGSGRQTWRESTMSSRASSRPRSRPRTSCGDHSGRKQKEFFKAELERLKNSLKRESTKIKKQKVKAYHPDLNNDLKPYLSTYTPQFLINMPEFGYQERQPLGARETLEKQKKEHRDESEGVSGTTMATRHTAIGLCDPWDDLNMDTSVLPILETSEMRKKRMAMIHGEDSPRAKSSAGSGDTEKGKKKRPKEAKEGSTRLPKFPVIALNKKDLATKELIYSDVPMLREELRNSYSHSGTERVNEDYKRTRQDIYRMELDRLSLFEKANRGNMRAAYFAYLQNTPGSRKAVYECMKDAGRKKKEAPQKPQAVA